MKRNEPKTGSVVYIVDLETGIFLAQIALFDPSGGAKPLSTFDPSPTSPAYKTMAPCDARGVTGTPVGFPTQPLPLTRFFISDALGRIFRIAVSSPDSSLWSNIQDNDTATQNTQHIALMHDLFAYETFTNPIMTSMAISINPRGELVLIGGTGDSANIESYDSTNKVFSLREVLGPQGAFQYAIHNYSSPLNKFTSVSPSTGKTVQLDAVGYSGEKMTGDPVVIDNVAYFTTFNVSRDTPPICGIPGEARIYGLHYNEPCTTSYCGSSGEIGRPDRNDTQRTPLLMCEISQGVNYKDTELKSTEPDALCRDLNYTKPAITTEPPINDPNKYEFVRYHGYGPNTLSMGPSVSYSPGQVTQVPSAPNESGVSTNNATTVEKKGHLLVQVSLSMREGQQNVKAPPRQAISTTGNGATGASNTTGLEGSFRAKTSQRSIRTTEWTLILDY